MKRVISILLTLLMLLPLFSNFVFAFDVPEDEEISNIAGEAELSVFDKNNMNITVGDEVDLSKIVDGDRNTGTHSPSGMLYSYILDYEKTYYFTDIVVDVYGSGTLANGEVVEADLCNLRSFQIILYDGDVETFRYEVSSATTEPEFVIEANAKADRIEFYKTYLQTTGTNAYVWEIETFSPKNMALCDAKLNNIEQEATFSATGANQNFWHAMDWKALTDGKLDFGTHTPKGRNYSIWMHFPKEYLMSKIDIYCNTDTGGKLASGDEIKGRYYGNNQMRVLVYNFNEELVWDSDLLDTSTSPLLEVEPYVDGAIIELQLNGNFGGGEYLWEIDVFSESGNHVFTVEDKQNPTCLLPGIKEKSCQCGKVIKESVDATGFHTWKTTGELVSPADEKKNGTLKVSCETCVMTKNVDIPALGHNWDTGTTTAPDCDSEGFTTYKCTDAGCNLSYVAEYKNAYGHIWDAGKVTKKSSVTEAGETTYTCLRAGCNGTKTTQIRKHKYTDNTVDFSADSITGVTVTPGPGGVGPGKDFYNPDSYKIATEGGKTMMGDKEVTVEKEIDPAYIFDRKNDTYWYAPSGSKLEINLDKEYVFTSGYAYLSGNWVNGTVEFFTINPDFNPSDPSTLYISTGIFKTGNINNGTSVENPTAVDMADSLSGGAKAIRIVITITDAKWENGKAFKWQGIDLKVHDCVITEADYDLEGEGYVAPTCTENGKCIATCQVCNVKTTITLEPSAKYGHKFDTSNLTSVTTPATCSATGIGVGNCLICGNEFTDVIIPATGNHIFERDNALMTPKCGFDGVAQKLCNTCDIVGEVYLIPSTGIHVYEWTTESEASYTAVGKKIYSCKFCGTMDAKDPDKGINEEIAEKLVVPEDLLTFKGYSVRTADFIGLRISFQLNLEYLKSMKDEGYNSEATNLLDTCDIRVITYVTDKDGNEMSIESYGKYSENKYNPTIDPQSVYDEYEIRTVVRVMNFRGIEFLECDMAELTGNTDGTVSIYDVANAALTDNSSLSGARKTFYENIVANKPE